MLCSTKPTILVIQLLFFNICAWWLPENLIFREWYALPKSLQYLNVSTINFVRPRISSVTWRNDIQNSSKWFWISRVKLTPSIYKMSRKLLTFLFMKISTDNVCIDSMSVTISRRTLDKSHGNVEALARTIRRLVWHECKGSFNCLTA